VGQLEEDGAAGAGVALVEGDEEVGEREARGEGDILLREEALPGLMGLGAAGLGGAAGRGLREEGEELGEVEGPLREGLLGRLVGLLEEGHDGLHKVGRFSPCQPLQVRCRQLVARGHRAGGFSTSDFEELHSGEALVLEGLLDVLGDDDDALPSPRAEDARLSSLCRFNAQAVHRPVLSRLVGPSILREPIEDLLAPRIVDALHDTGDVETK
jgi:hypothetical protein